MSTTLGSVIEKKNCPEVLVSPAFTFPLVGLLSGNTLTMASINGRLLSLRMTVTVEFSAARVKPTKKNISIKAIPSRLISPKIHVPELILRVQTYTHKTKKHHENCHGIVIKLSAAVIISVFDCLRLC